MEKRDILSLTLCSMFFLCSASGLVQAANLPTVEIVAFSPPSVGSFLAPIIEKKQTDVKNGVKINWVMKPSKAYNMGFASGEFKVGSSAALLSEALRRVKGVKTVFLFNTFDYFGAVLTRDPSIKALKDLEGRNFAADKVTTNYAMFMYFAKKEGVNLEKLNPLSAGSSALLTYITAGRVDAIQLWEPAFTQIMVEQPGKYSPIFYHKSWKKYTGHDVSPYLGVAAHEDWIKKDPTLVKKLYKAFKDAERWLFANPSEGAEIISKENQLPLKAMQELIKNNDQLGLHVISAEKVEKEIFEVFKAGLETGYIEKLPDQGIIYHGLE
jgi:NitT/TauT family transport system substrate-binding protein